MARLCSTPAWRARGPDARTGARDRRRQRLDRRLAGADRGARTASSGMPLGATAASRPPPTPASRLGRRRYVALLNNDAVPEPGWLEALVAALERRLRALVLRPRACSSPASAASTPPVTRSTSAAAAATTAASASPTGRLRRAAHRLRGVRRRGALPARPVRRHRAVRRAASSCRGRTSTSTCAPRSRDTAACTCPTPSCTTRRGLVGRLARLALERRNKAIAGAQGPAASAAGAVPGAAAGARGLRDARRREGLARLARAASSPTPAKPRERCAAAARCAAAPACESCCRCSRASRCRTSPGSDRVHKPGSGTQNACLTPKCARRGYTIWRWSGRL